MFFHQVNQQRFGEPLKTRFTKFPDHTANHLLLRLGGAIDIGAICLVFLEMFFLFEDLHHGHHGGVGDLPPFQQRLVDVAYRGVFALPDDFHDFQFLIGRVPLRGRILIN